MWSRCLPHVDASVTGEGARALPSSEIIEPAGVVAIVSLQGPSPIIGGPSGSSVTPVFGMVSSAASSTAGGSGFGSSACATTSGLICFAGFVDELDPDELFAPMTIASLATATTPKPPPSTHI